jgi:hypothetical protein
MKEKEIQAFIESLEVKALNGKQQSFSTAPLLVWVYMHK